MNSADVQDAVANEVNDRLSKATQELASKYAKGEAFVFHIDYTWSYLYKFINLLSYNIL